ncbi:MAG: hypothetical protein A2504_05285 [Bdellovibrionales bacterium RIFOXYD12_FULL_39_22]|nr:MAG: hypothetical protein A2385_06540 [Bdellovibrionales bacterium RIFOXYB1_FULL_39_21]OFZ41935.1 MAG: hypothetical protein A2485_08510 [Bdellovibrionales bacterium RIFOXYC12_FULL_39_17]OFZ50651.1 MAG: hypothetical protein A2404_05460 [Bdellovibrionales bacterium RIFOXYC1_FULL_39_130]OFZ71895.1 MAG: hypothetical protein A2451_01815 [Bdellovibrionales bacterium RIFOXYC2_FULL_39_8]OFZ77874.1 MAG: hypothetical protein A2560_00630 [Bdellovibrionales bacterium RIFOXYD1_FULL_39_84]OFZ93690.1 MAG:
MQLLVLKIDERIRENRMPLFFLLSLVAHLLIITYMQLRTIPFSDVSERKEFEVAQISPEELANIKAKIEKEDSTKKQVVSNEATGKEELPANSRFVGEHNQTYDKQTIARAIDSFKRAGRGRADGEKTKSVMAEQTKVPVLAKGRQIKLADLGYSIAGKKELVDITPADLDEASSLMEKSKAQVVPLGIGAGSLKESGLAANNDFIEDVPLGDMTNLNTTEFKYYGFYNRIRIQLEQYWGATLKEKARNIVNSGRKIASDDNKITALEITLNDRGDIVRIFIKSTSGIQEFDDAAVESFSKAGPFPNPPKEMLRNGEAILEWGFVVKV